MIKQITTLILIIFCLNGIISLGDNLPKINSSKEGIQTYTSPTGATEEQKAAMIADYNQYVQEQQKAANKTILEKILIIVGTILIIVILTLLFLIYAYRKISKSESEIKEQLQY